MNPFSDRQDVRNPRPRIRSIREVNRVHRGRPHGCSELIWSEQDRVGVVFHTLYIYGLIVLLFRPEVISNGQGIIVVMTSQLPGKNFPTFGNRTWSRPSRARNPDRLTTPLRPLSALCNYMNWSKATVKVWNWLIRRIRKRCQYLTNPDELHFQRTLFPRYPDLSLRLFGYFHYSSGSTTVDRISQSAFKSQVDKLLSVISDEALVEVYVKVSECTRPSVTRADNCSGVSFRCSRPAIQKLAGIISVIW